MKRRPLFPAAVQRRRRLAAASAPRAEPTRTPWPVRAGALLLILALGAALGSGLYEWVRKVAGLAPQVSASDAAVLLAERERLAAELQALQGRLNAADGRIEMERAAKDKLEAELRASQKEVGDLRNDLAFFEQLIPADPRMGQVSIRSAELEKQGTALRYRVLLMRSGRPSGEFKGTLQFSAVGTRGGATATVDLQPLVEPAAPGVAMPGGVRPSAPVLGAPLPAASASESPAAATPPGGNPLALSFRQYQRAEGALALPANFVPRTVTVRVLEGGAVRSQSTVNLVP
ncbi:DUF6776 family protein [Pigmentiphaga litoralis]|uniref:DUF6776 family protein n=1 Tax=Pigmentiphaga litoralis TaxID=516702 RepID=UPI00167971B7|nr:DUF6776 family protein [Pigmentiphaga litoralis]